MPPSTSTTGSAEREADAKRGRALDAARRAGADALVATTPATVRWLLCGRGRPVDAHAAESPYTLVVAARRTAVLFADLEAPRIAAEERFEELGYEALPYPWHEGRERAVAEATGAGAVATDAALEEALAPLRRELLESERARFRAAGADAGHALAATLPSLDPDEPELATAAELGGRLRAAGFLPAVVLVGGAERHPVYRHPIPTRTPLGPHALLAVTAERDGLYVSLTRIVSFGPPPPALAERVRAAATVDAAFLHASRPGATLGDIFDAGARAYADQGYRDEWRSHHQGGITGYRGREAFAVPGDPTPLPHSCAVAWNPSVGGGGKSEDSALVSREGVEVVTRTPELPELEVDGLLRPAIVEL